MVEEGKELLNASRDKISRYSPPKEVGVLKQQKGKKNSCVGFPFILRRLVRPHIPTGVDLRPE